MSRFMASKGLLHADEVAARSRTEERRAAGRMSTMCVCEVAYSGGRRSMRSFWARWTSAIVRPWFRIGLREIQGDLGLGRAAHRCRSGFRMSERGRIIKRANVV